MKPKSSIAWRTDFSSFAFDSGEGEENEEEGYKYRETEYYEGEKITKQIDYDKNGDITLELYNKFDDKGRIVESIEKNHEDELEEKTVLEYDAEGRVLSETQYYNDELFEKVVNIYNASGLLIEVTTYDADETPFTRQTREYDDKKHNVLIRHYEKEEDNENEELIWEIKRIFDQWEEPMEEITTIFKEKKIERRKFYYDQDGKRVKSELFDNKGNLSHSTIDEYDDKGNLVKQVTTGTFDNLSDSVITYVYDEDNHLTETENYLPFSQSLSSKETYSYNKDGQVIASEFYRNNAYRGMQKTHYLLRIEYSE